MYSVHKNVPFPFDTGMLVKPIEGYLRKLFRMCCLIAGNVVDTFSHLQLRSTFRELECRIIEQAVHLQLVGIDLACVCKLK